jgi:RimJ/RimL family protein N-acetyltransferase
MRYYGGVCDIARIDNRLALAIEHERRFGYGLWSLYDRRTGEFVGMSGIIHYNFDFDSETLELIACLKSATQRRGYARHLFHVLHDWCRDTGVLHRTLVRVESDHHQVKFFAFYEGHSLYPVVRRPSVQDERYLFFDLVPPPVIESGPKIA